VAAEAAQVLRMEDITKHYGGVRALENVQFASERGRIHALLGENGAGKSTLIKVLSGVVRPDSGRVLIDGAPVSFASPMAAMDAGVACIFQELSLLPDRTVVNLASTGQIGHFVSYVNTIIGGLRNPRSVGWNVELDRQITSDLTVRAGFQQRNTARDFLLTPETGLDHAILSLSNSARSFYREFQVSGAYKIRRGSLNASYVRSKAY